MAKKISLTLDEIRRIESFYQMMFNWLSGNVEFVNMLGEKVIEANLTEPDRAATAQNQLIVFFLDTMHRTAINHDNILAGVQRAKKEMGVQLDPAEVTQAVRDLFAQIKKELG